MRDTTNTDESRRYMRGIQLPSANGQDASREGAPRRGTPREQGRPLRESPAPTRARRTSPSGSPRAPRRRTRPARPAPTPALDALSRLRPPLSPAVIAVVVAVVAVILGSSYLFRPQGTTETVPVNAGSQDETPSEQPQEPEEQEPEGPQNMSTPQSEWRQGVMPYLYQTDPQYADASYSNGTFAKQGCGPTALATVYIYLTGDTSMGPLEMAEFSTENGFSTDGNGSSWTLMSDGAAMLGLSSETLPAVPARLAEALESGHPLICVMAPGTFTEVGHYITLERLDEDGKAVVHDSNSVERSSQTWDLELICSEAVNIWSFSVA